MKNLNNILLLDCASEPCGVLVSAINNDIRINFYESFSANTACEKIIPIIDNLLILANTNINQINLIVWNQGPGSFTSIRISSAIIQGLALAHNLKVMGINACEFLLAQINIKNINEGENILCAINARANEIYWAVYIKETNHISNIKPLAVDKPDIIKNYCEKNSLKINFGIGNAFTSYRQLLNLVSGEIIINHQELLIGVLERVILQNNNFVEDVNNLLPIYIRDDVAQKTNAQKVWQERMNVSLKL